MGDLIVKATGVEGTLEEIGDQIIYLFFRHKVLSGWARYIAFAIMIIYIFFLVLALSPGARAFVISYGLSPTQA